jgi:hypothetical protein
MTLSVKYLMAVAALGLAVAVSSCTGSRPQPQARSGSEPLPRSSSAGAPAAPDHSQLQAAYQRIGGAAQGVSVEVPASWKTVDFSRQTVQQALGIVGGQGGSLTSLTQALDPLAKLHAAYAADVATAATAPGHFITNLNAYCSSSGISESGSTGVAIIGRDWASQLQQDGAQNLAQTATSLAGVAGVQSSYTLSAQSAGPLHAVQLEVLPKAGQACFVTLTAAGPVPAAVLARAISSIQFP